MLPVPWAGSGSRYTLLFESFVLSRLKISTADAVRKQHKLSWNAVDGIMTRLVKRDLALIKKPLSTRHMNVDEVAFIACADGLKGFPDAINAVYPVACIQLCIVHMVRNSLRFVCWKDDKAVTLDLKAIDQASTEEAGLQVLEAFESAWDSRYLLISRIWQANRANLATFFA